MVRRERRYIRLSSENAQAYGIGINNSGVHVIGTVNAAAAYLNTNHTAARFLPSLNAGYSGANGLYTNGTNVFVAGSIEGSAAYWKDTTLTVLNTNNSNASAITFDGTHVYISGYSLGTRDTAILWKDKGSNPVYLTVGTNLYTYATGIAINGNNIYVVGGTSPTASSPTVAAYWKNSTSIPFKGGELKGIATVGNDVYIIGTEETNSGTACYWKNGVIRALPRANVATGIVVVTHPH